MHTRVALVTGAARGIGAATALALAADGWRVAALDLCGRNEVSVYPMGSRAELDAVVESCGEGAVALEADVGDADAVGAAVSDVLGQFGRVDCVVAAAGVVAGGQPLWETSDAEWQAVMATDLTGVFNTIRATVPAILEHGEGGRVVCIASAAGSLGLRDMGAYAAAKHGVIGLTRSLASDLAATGVTANVVSPGSTSTGALDASSQIYELASVDDFVRHQEPLGRLIRPAEVAATVAWLCSPAASAITGAILAVDGGMTATP